MRSYPGAVSGVKGVASIRGLPTHHLGRPAGVWPTQPTRSFSAAARNRCLGCPAPEDGTRPTRTVYVALPSTVPLADRVSCLRALSAYGDSQRLWTRHGPTPRQLPVTPGLSEARSTSPGPSYRVVPVDVELASWTSAVAGVHTALAAGKDGGGLFVRSPLPGAGFRFSARAWYPRVYPDPYTRCRRQLGDCRRRSFLSCYPQETGGQPAHDKPVAPLPALFPDGRQGAAAARKYGEHEGASRTERVLHPTHSGQPSTRVPR